MHSLTQMSACIPSEEQSIVKQIVMRNLKHVVLISSPPSCPTRLLVLGLNKRCRVASYIARS